MGYCMLCGKRFDYVIQWECSECYLEYMEDNGLTMIKAKLTYPSLGVLVIAQVAALLLNERSRR